MHELVLEVVAVHAVDLGHERRELAGACVELRHDMRVVVEDLHVDEAADISLGELVVIELKVKLPLDHWELPRLNTRQALEVRVVEGLESRGSIRGVEGEKVSQQVQGQGISGWELLGKVLGGLGRHRMEEGPCLDVGDAVNGADTGLPYQVGDEVELTHSLTSRKQGLASKGLGKDAANAPNVDSMAVAAVEAAAELWSTVPSRGNIVGPVCGGRFPDKGPSQAKVADLELAVAVGKNVLGLQVAVEDARLVDEGQSSEELVEEDLREERSKSERRFT